MTAFVTIDICIQIEHSHTLSHARAHTHTHSRTHPVAPPPHRTLSLDNQVQCAPLSAQQRAALYYQGPVTCISIPWTVALGGCSFSGNYAGAPLVRTGSCPTENGFLSLDNMGITSVSADTFQGMSQMT
jgi:hypothetical protein